MRAELSELRSGMKSQTPATATSGGQRGRGKVVREPETGSWLPPMGTDGLLRRSAGSISEPPGACQYPHSRRASSEFVKYGTVALWRRAWWGRAASPHETHDTPSDAVRRELDMTKRQSTIDPRALFLCFLNYNSFPSRRVA